jgi:hypothetical protein
MRLQSYAVQRHILVAQRAQQLQKRLALGGKARAHEFDVVFVQHQACGGIDHRRGAQRDRHVIRAQIFGPDAGTQRRCVLRMVHQRLVHHVPGRDDAAISGHNRLDMVDQFPLGLSAAGDLIGPFRQAAVPGQRVAADLKPVLAREIDDRVGFLEAVFAARGTDIGPLHLAFGNDQLTIRDNRFAIGGIGLQRAGAHRRTVGN